MLGQCLIEALIIDELFRGNGIGKKLINFLERIVYHHRPAIIDLTSGLRRSKDGTQEFIKLLVIKMKVIWQNFIYKKI
ncbi:MAG: hypothetical protein RCG15_01685 [Candidatus Rickettsia vulgarisii]